MPKALVVDDSRAMRMLIGRALKRSGFEVVECANGSEALDQMVQDPAGFDLALVDWNMPVLNGLEFVEQVRERPHWNHMKLVMVTSETEVDMISAALTAGADEYMMKPFTDEALTDKLRLLGALE